MSTELATPAIAEATPATPRVPVEPNRVRRLNSGSVVMVRTAEDTPETDRAIYFEEMDRNNDGQFKGYTLTPTGAIADYVAHGLNVSDVMIVAATDYYAYQRTARYRNAKGQFAKVPVNRLPEQFMTDAEARTGKRPQRYTTFAEVLEVSEQQGNFNAKLRVFTHSTDTPEALEYGTVDVESLSYFDPEFMTPEQFQSMYALAATLWTVGKLYYIDAELVECVSTLGVVGKFAYLNEETAEVDSTREQVAKSTDYRNAVVAGWDSKADYLQSLPSPEVQEKLLHLSRNTITRALKHADSNNYCSETAVALTSAGHVMPEVTLKGRIVIDIDVRSKEYMLLRRLFGAGNEDMSNLSDVVKSQWVRVAENLPGLPNRLPEGATVEIDAGINWKAPKLRPLN